jgi:hypothetical protein
MIIKTEIAWAGWLPPRGWNAHPVGSSLQTQRCQYTVLLFCASGAWRSLRTRIDHRNPSEWLSDILPIRSVTHFFQHKKSMFRRLSYALSFFIHCTYTVFRYFIKKRFHWNFPETQPWNQEVIDWPAQCYSSWNRLKGFHCASWLTDLFGFLSLSYYFCSRLTTFSFFFYILK